MATDRGGSGEKPGFLSRFRKKDTADATPLPAFTKLDREQFLGEAGTGTTFGVSGEQNKELKKPETEISQDTAEKYKQFSRNHANALNRLAKIKTIQNLPGIGGAAPRSYESNRLTDILNNQDLILDKIFIEKVCDVTKNPDGVIVSVGLNDSKVNSFLQGDKTGAGFAFMTHLLEEKTELMAQALAVEVQIDPPGGRGENLGVGGSQQNVHIDGTGRGRPNRWLHRLHNYATTRPGSAGRGFSRIQNVGLVLAGAVTGAEYGAVFGAGLGRTENSTAIGALVGAAAGAGSTLLIGGIANRGLSLELHCDTDNFNALKAPGGTPNNEMIDYVKEMSGVDLNDFDVNPLTGNLEIVPNRQMQSRPRADVIADLQGMALARFQFVKEAGVPESRIDALSSQFTIDQNGRPEAVRSAIDKKITSKYQADLPSLGANPTRQDRLELYQRVRRDVLYSAYSQDVNKSLEQIVSTDPKLSSSTLENVKSARKENGSLYEAAVRPHKERKELLEAMAGTVEAPGGELQKQHDIYTTYEAKRRGVEDLNNIVTAELSKVKDHAGVIISTTDFGQVREALNNVKNNKNSVLLLDGYGRIESIKKQSDQYYILGQRFIKKEWEKANTPNPVPPARQNEVYGIIMKRAADTYDYLKIKQSQDTEAIEKAIERINELERQQNETQKALRAGQPEADAYFKLQFEQKANYQMLVPIFATLPNPLNTYSLDEIMTAVNTAGLWPASENQARVADVIQAVTEARVGTFELTNPSYTSYRFLTGPLSVAPIGFNLSEEQLLTLTPAEIELEVNRKILNPPFPGVPYPPGALIIGIQEAKQQAIIAMRERQRVNRELAQESRNRLTVANADLEMARHTFDAELNYIANTEELLNNRDRGVRAATEAMLARVGVGGATNPILERAQIAQDGSFFTEELMSYDLTNGEPLVGPIGVVLPRGYLEILDKLFDYRATTNNRGANLQRLIKFLPPVELAERLASGLEITRFASGAAGFNPTDIRHVLADIEERLSQRYYTATDIARGFDNMIKQLRNEVKSLPY